MIYVYTSAANNYLDKAKVLFESVRKYHPEFKLCLALADKLHEGFSPQDFNVDEIVTISDLNISRWKSWAFYHTMIELCTGIKPFMLKYLLSKEDCEAVLYIDPDIVVFSRLDDLLDEFKQNSIILTPHLTKPESTLEAILDNEVSSLRHGIYNLGFIGVKNDKQGVAFSDWWSERLYYFCSEELEQGFWMDQKWIDFVPAFFDGVKIVKSSRLNVAPWNITTRKLSGNFEQGFTVDGQPLGFYHFTGLDSGAHVMMANKYAKDNSAIEILLDWYNRATGNNQNISDTQWAFSTFDNGIPISHLHRTIYRMRKDLQDIYPDPFSVVEGEDCYYNYFISRAVNEHPDLFDSVTQGVKDTTFQLPHYNKVKRSIVWQLFRKAVINPRYGLELSRRAVIILLEEGFTGLKRHLRSM